MASDWVHASIDLMAFGRSYFDLHQYKDHPWKQLGYKHRGVNHEWYNEFDKSWDFTNPFPSIIHMRTEAKGDPDEAEKFQAMVSHDYIDKIWGTLNQNQREELEQKFRYLLQNPEELNKICEIDVNCGLIYRVIDGKKIAEYCPELINEYRRLRNYISAF